MTAATVAAIVALTFAPVRVTGDEIGEEDLSTVRASIQAGLDERGETPKDSTAVALKPGPGGDGFLYRVDVADERVVPAGACPGCSATDVGARIVGELADAGQLHPVVETEPEVVPVPAAPSDHGASEPPSPGDDRPDDRRPWRILWSGIGLVAFGGVAAGFGGAGLDWVQTRDNTGLRNASIAGLAIGGSAFVAGVVLAAIGGAKLGGPHSKRLHASRGGLQIRF